MNGVFQVLVLRMASTENGFGFIRTCGVRKGERDSVKLNVLKVSIQEATESAIGASDRDRMSSTPAMWTSWRAFAEFLLGVMRTSSRFELPELGGGLPIERLE